MNQTIRWSLLTLFWLLLNQSYTFGQGCENTDFEYGNFTNWDTYTGFCCGAAINTPGVVPNRHTIITSSYPDANTNGVIMSMPPIGGGTYTVRLGNDNVGSEAEKLIRQFIVTPQNQLFTYQYALVLEDPSGHSPNDKPKFEVKVYDQNQNIINPPECGYYQVTAGPETSTSEWGQYGTVRYKDWSTVGLDLSSYMGQQITIQFTVQDCGLGGHFGYAYLDASCGYLDIEVIGFCEGSSTVTLIAPDGFDSYFWPHSNETTQTVQIPTPDPGDSIEVLVTNQSGCATTVLKVFEEYPLPVVTAGNDTLICAGQTIPIWSDGNLAVANYTWFANGTQFSTDQNLMVTPLVTTDYTVFVTNKNGCYGGDSSATVHVEVLSNLVFDLQDSLYVCNGDSYPFSSPISNPNYNWTFGGSTVSTDSSFSFTPASSGYLTLTLGNADCTFSDSIKIVAQNDQPLYDTVYVPYCDNVSSVTLEGPTGNLNYLWTTNETTVNINVPAIDSTEFTVSFETPIGCTDSMHYVLDLEEPPTPTISTPFDSVCLEQYAMFSATSVPSGATFQWLNLQTGDTYTGSTIGFDVKQNTTLIVQAYSSGGCTDPTLNDTVQLYVDSSAYFQFPPDYTICGPYSDTIYGPANMDSYSWFLSGQTVSSLDYHISDSLSERYYYLTVEKNNCYYTDFIYIDHYDVQTYTDVKYACTTATNLVMEAPQGYASVYWVEFNNNFPSNNATPIAHGDIYNIYATTNDGCVDTFIYVINFVDLSVLQPLSDTTICHDGTAQFTAQSSYTYDTYTWTSSPAGFNASSKTIFDSPGTTTQYTVTMTNPYNCVAVPNSRTVTVEVDTSYVIPDIPPVTICPWDEVNIDMTGYAGTISWSYNGQNFAGSTLTFNPTQSGILYATSTKGVCSYSTSTNIDVHPSDNFVMDYGNVTLCNGVEIDMNLSPVTYTDLTWYNNGDILGTTNPISFTGDGDAYITATLKNSKGCDDTLNYLLQFTPLPVVELGPDQAPCEIEPVLLQAKTSAGVVDYEWNTLENTPTIYAYATGYYFVTVTNSNGCENTDSVHVELDSPSYIRDLPNVFTPNGDNVNEVLELDHKNVVDFNLQIFNRWGNLLFETNDPDDSWDGDTKGKPSNDGVYFYKVVYQLDCESTVFEKQGFVTVTR